MPDERPARELTLMRLLRERSHLFTDPAAWERARAEALAAETGYDFETSLRVIRGVAPPEASSSSPAGHSDMDIHEDYPTLPPGAVDAVRRWAADLDEVIEMVRGAPDDAYDPPRRLTSPHNIMAAYARGEIAGLDAARLLHLESLDALHAAMRDVGQHAMPPFAEEALYPVENGPLLVATPWRSARTLYVDALDALLEGRVGAVAHSRDWELLREVARLAQEDAPRVLATTDPALFEKWRAAVTRYHVAGWGHMTPASVHSVMCRTRPGLPGEPAGID